jgi:hypothetical protein
VFPTRETGACRVNVTGGSSLWPKKDELEWGAKKSKKETEAKEFKKSKRDKKLDKINYVEEIKQSK